MSLLCKHGNSALLFYAGSQGLRVWNTGVI